MGAISGGTWSSVGLIAMRSGVCSTAGASTEPRDQRIADLEALVSRLLARVEEQDKRITAPEAEHHELKPGRLPPGGGRGAHVRSQMILTLERGGHIRRTPGVARSIELLVDPERLPVLREPIKTSVERY
ncbi:MAG: hypothetical protein WBV82_12340 [Myxococcaceae bacterium]